MKQWFCSYCKRRKETENNVVLVQCRCGKPMEEIKEDDDGKNNKRNN